MKIFSGRVEDFALHAVKIKVQRVLLIKMVLLVASFNVSPLSPGSDLWALLGLELILNSDMLLPAPGNFW